MALAVILTALAGPCTGFAQVKTNAPLVTDAQVLESIQKGVHYLLAQKKGNHWETKFDAKGKPVGTIVDGMGTVRPDVWAGQNFGGETALILYALLHVGHSVQDDPELGPKLRFNSAELEPVVKWLATEVRPDATYTAGLHASALALVPPRTDGGKVASQGLKSAYQYITTAMDRDGGYTYRAPGAAADSPIAMWRDWMDATNKTDADKARREFESLIRQSFRTFGGSDGVLRLIAADIKDRDAAARSKRDQAALQKLQVEARQLQAFSADVAKLRATNTNEAQRQLTLARTRLEEARRAKQTGEAYREVEKKDASGAVVRGADGKPVRERIRKTAEEIDKELAEAEARIKQEEADVKNNFSPIGDLSNAQYGTLGAWALSDVNVEIPTEYWRVADRFWRLSQRQDGGWAYMPDTGPSRLSMTTAGLASLFITSEMVDTQLRLEPRPDKEIERGIAWLNTNFRPTTDCYTMYGVERVGLASGIKFFGTIDWYTEGALTLIRAQKPDGSIGVTHGSPSVSTAYALLFLARGRNPVIFNKLEYEGPWNARPRDAANVTDWMSKNFERPINWQVVNLKVEAEGWLDAPILLITGSKALNLAPDDIAKLRNYIRAGGMIFSTADGGKPEFTQSIVQVASQVVEGKYEMREMPPEHPLFAASLWAEVKRPPRMLALSNGVREVWIHSTVDMGASWQMRRNAQAADHFVIPAKLNQYATGKGVLRGKLTPLAVPDRKTPIKTKLTLARIDFGDNPDPEPGAWPRLARILANETGTGLDIKSVRLPALNAKDTPVAHFTGTTRFTASPEDIAALRKFIDDGGTLFIDAIGDSAHFRTSATDLAKAVLPDAAPEELPSTHPLIKGSFDGGVDVSTADYRKFAKLKTNTSAAPRILAFPIKNKQRTGIYYSELDITSGLLGTNTWGIVGYAPKTAEGLARNIILFAARANSPASTQAAVKN